MKNKNSNITTKQILKRLHIRNLLNVNQLDFDLEIANSAIAMFGAYIVSMVTTISMLIDGVELYKEIRKRGITVPIFILTANADKSYEDLYRETGFTAKLDKPVQMQDLFSLIVQYK